MKREARTFRAPVRSIEPAARGWCDAFQREQASSGGGLRSSKALGAPEAWVGTDGDSEERISIVLLWGELSWRRYVCRPGWHQEGLEIYFDGVGEDPEEIRRAGCSPNAHVDAGERVYLGLRPD